MEKIRGLRDKHPSGKSLRRVERRSYADGYANREGPKTVRLSHHHDTQAIGFIANLTRDEDNE